jgi:3-oxoacyl-[acyl-carrier protein] reductase
LTSGEAEVITLVTVKLEGKAAVVTGGSRGIGRAISLALAAEGAGVAVNYRSGEAEANEVVAAIEDAGGKAVAVQGDVGEYDDATRIVQETVDKLGGVHILVNNAGIARDVLIFSMEPNDWLDVMKINFGGVFNFTKACLPHFMSQRDGVIVNVSSVMGERGWTGESNYAASKGAINAFTRCCAMEVARFGIRVNAVLPGFVTTEMVAGLLEKDAGKGILKQLPLRSFADADDVASAVVFLASPDADYMTGAFLTLDGGASAMLGLGRQTVER